MNSQKLKDVKFSESSQMLYSCDENGIVQSKDPLPVDLIEVTAADVEVYCAKGKCKVAMIGGILTILPRSDADILSDAIALKRKALKDRYEYLIYSNIDFNGYVFQADFASIQNIVEALATTNTDVLYSPWYDASNQAALQTKTELQSLLNAISQRTAGYYSTLQALKSQAEAATSIQQLDVIVF